MYIQVQQQAVDSDLTHYVESEVVLSVTDPTDPQAPPWPPDNLVFINRFHSPRLCRIAVFFLIFFHTNQRRPSILIG